MKFFNRYKEMQIDVTSILLDHMATSLNITEMAIEKAIDMYAKIIAKAEFEEYRKIDKKIQKAKDHLYYVLNVRTNSNELATDFWRRVVRKLLREGHCLIVPMMEGLYIADSFTKNNIILSDTIFSQISIGELTLNRKFKSSEVIYLQNRNKRILRLMKAFNEAYAELISVSLNAYKVSNAPKFKLPLPSQIKFQRNGKDVDKNDYILGIESQLSSSDLKVISLGMDINLEEIAKQNKSPEDLLKIENHIKETIAFVFDIPIDVFIGKTTEKSNAMNDLITFGASPIIEIINDGVNAWAFTEDEFLAGEKVCMNQTTLKHVDVLDVAVQIDKLFADGFSHNDICGFIGINGVDEPWADEHHITKNYENVKGGDENG